MTSERIKNVALSATGEFANKVARLRNEGVKIYSFNIGEPDFAVPAKIKEASQKALEEGKTKYTSINGLKQLRDEVADKLANENGLVYSPDNICITCGVKQALHEVFFAICNDGDEVIIPTPCWVSYIEMAKLAGAKPICVNTKPDYSLDLNSIKKAITENTKAVVINSPNNPTGAVYDKKSLEELARLAVEHDFYVISDEVYEKIVYDGHNHISIGALNNEIFKRTITLNGFSKAYAMTGMRLGYVAGPEDIIKAVCTLQSHNTSNAPTPFQWAAITALKECKNDVDEMVKVFARRRKLMISILEDIPGLKFVQPSGAFYILVDVSSFFDEIIGNASEFCNFMLEKYHVAFVPGEAFMASNCIRISFATDEKTIEEGLSFLRDALKH